MSVTISDVARHANVSPATVSKFLNTPHRVAPATSERISAAISTLGYVRNDAARQLRAGRSRILGLLAFDVENPFFLDLARLIASETAALGLSVVLGDSQGSVDREREFLALFEEQRVRGLLVAPVGDISDHLVRMRSHGMPIVLLDQDDPHGRLPSISFDDHAGGELAAGHLISRGCRRLAFVGGGDDTRQARDRLAGAVAAVEKHPGIRLDMYPTRGRTVEYGRSIAETILMKPRAERPDGIVTVNDRVAFGLLQTLVVEGRVRVPEEIAIIGYDDIEFASAAVVPLSSVRQHKAEFAAQAVSLLAEMQPRPSRIVLTPELVIRDSTRRRLAPAPSSALGA